MRFWYVIADVCDHDGTTNSIESAQRTDCQGEPDPHLLCFAEAGPATTAK